MNRYIAFGAGIALMLFFLSMLFTFQVNFDETVLVTTFGRATEQSVLNTNGGQAGLHFKWPWPVQRVIRLDRRFLVIEDQLEQQETRDKHVVIAKAFAVWRINNALAFYRMFPTNDEADAFVRERLRSAKGELSNFTFDELTNADPGKLKLDEVGTALTNRIAADLSHHDCGVEVSKVGVSRIVLPERITLSVFSRMKQTRQRMAQNTRSEGLASAQRIVAQTNSDKERIVAFAERLANNIRAEGDAAAAKSYAAYRKNPDFALFLKKLDALEKSLSKNTTFILGTDSEPFDLLSR